MGHSLDKSNNITSRMDTLKTAHYRKASNALNKTTHNHSGPRTIYDS